MAKSDGPDTSDALVSVQRVIADMREAAKQWGEAYPSGSVRQSARVNFANWITSYADRLSEVVDSAQPADAVANSDEAL